MGDSAGLLAVCTANVCRSPLAAALLAEGTGLPVSSAGVRALEGAPMCAVSATRAPGAADVEGHRGRPLTPELVRGAGLVLTMEREQRSAAVRLAPGTQSSVFTLREAAALLDGLVDRGTAPLPDLRALAAAMHGVRGVVPIPVTDAPRRRWWQRPVEPEDPLTIVDGHGLDEPEHLAAVDRVADASRAVAASLARLLV